MQAVVDSLLTNYEQKGKSKKTVLFLHGWGDNHATFSQLTDSLSSDYTVIALDLPGFGATQPPQNVWGLEEYSSFIKSFLLKIKVAEPDAIIAHSNGGSVAITGLANRVLKTKKLILLASAGIRNRQKGKRFFLKVIAKSGKVITVWLPKKSQQKLRQKFYGTIGSDMYVSPQLQETFKKTVRQDVQADARKLSVPTLLIYGTKDKATPVIYGEIFNNLIEGSRLEVVNGASHFVHHDQPEKVAKLVKDFLA